MQMDTSVQRLYREHIAPAPAQAASTAHARAHEVSLKGPRLMDCATHVQSDPVQSAASLRKINAIDTIHDHETSTPPQTNRPSPHSPFYLTFHPVHFTPRPSEPPVSRPIIGAPLTDAIVDYISRLGVWPLTRPMTILAAYLGMTSSSCNISNSTSVSNRVSD